MTAKEIAESNDGRIYQMAIYYVSEGMLKDDITQDEITEKAREFKAYIKRGSFNIDQLEASVYEKHGVVKEDPAHEDLLKSKPASIMDMVLGGLLTNGANMPQRKEKDEGKKTDKHE